MNQHNCPHCGEPGISALRKCCLGPAFPAKCRECGKKVGVPYWSILTILPMIFGFTVGPHLFEESIWIAFFATFVTLVSWTLWESFVPLQRR